MPRVQPTEETPCNLCGRRDYDVIGTKDRERQPLQTTICRACGLVWTNPRPPLEALDRYYRLDYRTDYQNAPRPTPRKVLRGLLGALDRRRRLAPVWRPGARALDVGCGAGELVFLMRAAGIDASGLEPDEAFAQFARERLQVPVETGTVATAATPDGSLDFATMFHALEHVGDPVAVVAAIARWLRPSGLLAIEVPNVEARCHAPTHRFHFAHLFAFSTGTLAGVATRAGLTPVSMALTEDGGNIVGLFRKEDAPPPPPDLSSQYRRTRAILDAHTTWRHYLSPTPYQRTLSRARRRRLENRLLAQHKTIAAILDWARQSGVVDPPS